MESIYAWSRSVPAKWRSRIINFAMFVAAFVATVVLVEVLA
ncbi:MAG: hypothetical protein P8Q36_02255 [Alphaproteobacteria bacterium]|jgi:hypothetical protein|nr:hypothetical protein [Alphaproteobacteria bacterium]